MPDAGINADEALDAQPLLPVRRLHNYVYCPRLCYLQWVENLFVENEDTVAGSAAHRNVDRPSSFTDEKKEALAGNLPEGTALRSLHLSSKTLGLTGIVDLLEGGAEGGQIVDYKRGSARRDPETGERIAKEYDAVQVAAHALLLREAGYKVHAASIYYAADKRHIPVELSDELLAYTRESMDAAKRIAESKNMPPPLEHDYRCSYCSAYPVCLPGESAWWAAAKIEKQSKDPQIRLHFPESNKQGIQENLDSENDTPMPPRPERLEGEVLVVQTPGMQVGQRGGEFVVSQKREILRKLPIQQVRSIYLYGAVQLTAQAAQTCLQENVSVAYFSPAGRFLGALQGLPASGVDARLGQYDLFKHQHCCVQLAGECIRAKIRNQRVMLMRNGSPEKVLLNRLARAAQNAGTASSLEEIRGIEGGAAAIYFKEFASMLKDQHGTGFEFKKRNRRPPRDPVNALLSLGYSILAKELAGICHVVGLDPFYGFFHQHRYGRPALALDLMEEFRPLVADSVAISLINRGELDQGDFLFSSRGVSLGSRGRRSFWEAWFRRLDTEVTHPEFKYRMSYRRMMEVQARQLWRFVRGEAAAYHGFTTR